MRAEHWTLQLSAWAVFSLLVSPGLTQEARPAAPPSFTPYVDRDLSIAPGAIWSSLVLSVARPERPLADSIFGVSPGVGTGIVQGLWVEAYAGTIELSPAARWRDPKVGLFYQLTNTYPFELDPAVSVTFDPGEGRVVKRIDPGVIMVLRAGHEVRLDTGAYLPLSFDEKTTVGLNIPVRLGVQLATHVHAGMTTGASWPDLTGPGRSATFPLGFFAGYSALVGNGVSFSMSPSFSWPTFFVPGSADPLQTRPFVIELATSLYVTL